MVRVVYRHNQGSFRITHKALVLFVFLAGVLISSAGLILRSHYFAGAAISPRSTDDLWYTANAIDTGYNKDVGCNLDQYGYCLRNCTSYTAQRLGAAGVKADILSGLGNGGSWYSSAFAKGVSVGSVPKIGAAAVITGSPGHVGFVTAVHSNGSIDVASYNGGIEQPQFENNVTRYSHFVYFSNVGSNQPTMTQHGTGVRDAVYKGSQLSKGQTLRANEYLASHNLTTALIMQKDGNLVLYGPKNGVQYVALWQSGTSGTNADRVSMQTDGNLVIYKGSKAMWQSRTPGTSNVYATLQNDGNFVLYSGSRAVWHTKTGGKPQYSYFGSSQLKSGQQMGLNKYLRSGNGKYVLLLQSDGNLVLYSAGYHVLWNSKTSSRGVDRLVMQGDGNLVLYDGSTARWNSKTNGTDANNLILQNDGNLVLYADFSAKWHTKTSGKI